MNWDNIPNELKILPQWVCWGVDPNNPKMPHNPNNMTPAKASDPATWGSFELAIQRVADGKAQGIGFQFNSNGIVGVDLDHCIAPVTGEVKAWAKDIVQTLDSYTEVSMSGTGFHILVNGKKSGTRCKKELNKNTKEAVEIYENGRYFIMTGSLYNEKPIAERNGELKAVYDSVFSVQESAQDTSEVHPIPQSKDYLQVGLERDEKLNAYWHGQRPSQDESSNDMGFMNKLAYWCNKDKEAMIKAFLSSPYAEQKDEAQKKKLERDDYLSRTADGAIASCRSTAAEDDRQYNEKKAKTQSKSESVTQCDPQTWKSNKGLSIISAQDLQNANLPPIKYLIDDFLPTGASLIAAAPKYGKSWLVLLMGLRIAAGEPFLRWETQQAGVLYLSFEDSLNRLQSRMNKLFDGANPPPWFYFSTDRVTLDGGLLETIEDCVKEYPEIKLVIIDTFQKIRGTPLHGERWYEHDYREAGTVKEAMDKKGISVLFVHHVNKTKDKDDPFNEIAGTNGISGVMDTMFVLKKKSRHAKQATLHTTGRDVADDDIVICFNPDNGQWEFVGDAEELAKQEALNDYVVNAIPKTIKALIDETTDKRWSGNAKSLLEAGERFFGVPLSSSSQSLSKALTNLKDLLQEQDNIIYTISSNGNAGNTHHFRYMAEVENVADSRGEDEEAAEF